MDDKLDGLGHHQLSVSRTPPRNFFTNYSAGHIFDHTIDSLNCALGGLLQVASLGVGPSAKGLTLLLVPCTAMWFVSYCLIAPKVYISEYNAEYLGRCE